MEPALVIRLDEYEHLGSLEVSRSMSVGETTLDTAIAAKPGSWRVWYLDADRSDDLANRGKVGDEGCEQLVLIHAGASLPKDFTPTTLYNDYPLSLRRFHWESQGSTRLESETGRRYRNPPPGWRVLLFVRQAKKDERNLTMPCLFLGPVRCVSASGERPIQIVWELEREMPAGWFSEVKIAAA